MSRLIRVVIVLLFASFFSTGCHSPLETGRSATLTNRELLLSDQTLKIYPVWAPDGSRLLVTTRGYYSYVLRRDYEGETVDTLFQEYAGISSAKLSIDRKKFLIQKSASYLEAGENNSRILDITTGEIEAVQLEYPIGSSKSLWDSETRSLYTYQYSPTTLLEVAASGEILREFDLTPLTSLGTYSIDPTRRHFALDAFADTVRGIWILEDGVNLKLIAQSNDSVLYFNPLWSGDGATVSFIERMRPVSGGQKSRVVLYDVYGGTTDTVAYKAESIHAVRWMPDTDDLTIYATERYQDSVYADRWHTDTFVTEMNPFSGEILNRQEPRSLDTSTWIPEFQEWLFIRMLYTYQISALDQGTGALRPLTPPSMKSITGICFRDNETAVYSTYDGLYELDIGTRDIRTLLAEDQPDFQQYTIYGYIRNPDCTADRRLICFVAHGDIYQYDCETDSLSFMSYFIVQSLSNPVWSPDGSRLACVEADTALTLFSVQDNRLHREQSISGDFETIHWSPVTFEPGPHILYTDGYTGDLNMISTENQMRYRIVDRDDYRGTMMPCWHPDGRHITYLVNNRELFSQLLYTDLTEK